MTTEPIHYEQGSLKPYLELPHILSLTWLAYPILSLLFVAFRLQLSLGSAEDAIARAKDNLITSCAAAEQAATATASMPRYLAIASNEQYASAVNASMDAARQALVLSLTVMEAIINFIIDLYRSTLLCFLELVIRGGLAILIEAVEQLNNLVQTVSGGLRTSIQNDIASANSAIQSAIDGINSVNPFGDIGVPQIATPDLSSLDSIQLPSSISDTLNQLNSSMPTFQDIKDKIEEIVNTPFELVKKDINDTFATINFDSSLLPVPAQNRLAFCGEVDTSVVDDLGNDLMKTFKIGIIVIILFALLLIACNCLIEWYKWRCLRQNLEYTRQAWMSDPTMYSSPSMKSSPISTAPTMALTDHNLMILYSSSDHPLITRIVNQLSARLRLSPSKHTSLQWFLSYIFHTPALACLLIGVFGILCVQAQLFALGPLVQKYEDRAASSVTDFNTLITNSVNANMLDQSTLYAQSVNAQVDEMQNNLNNGLFGWVNGTTTTLNQTLNEFYTDIQDAVSLVFNNTFLEQPAQEFIRCLIGTKVDALENALTFLHDNLVVNVPRMNDTALMLSPESVNEATRPVAAAAIGGGDDDSGFVGKIVTSYAEGLKKERIMFAIFIALWGVVVLLGLLILLWHGYGKPALERRKKRKYETKKMEGMDGFIVPYRIGSKTSPSDDLTPLPSPRPEAADPFARSSYFNNASPAPTNEKSWNSSLPQRDPPNSGPFTSPISKPRKLIAFGRKALRRETLVPDQPLTDEETLNLAKARNTAWYGRFAAVLSREEQQAADASAIASRRNKPELHLSITPPRTSDATECSRWSGSPDAREIQPPHFPWMGRRTSGASPVNSKAPSTPPGLAPGNRLIGVPIRANDHSVNVPADITAISYEDSILGGAPGPGTPLALAPPLHHGFYPPPPKQPGLPNNPYPHPVPQGLAPPRDHHRRSVAIPASKFKEAPQNLSPFDDPTSPQRVNRVSNPFTTPFDDVHQVQISPPEPSTIARRSIPTHAFNPSGMAL